MERILPRRLTISIQLFMTHLPVIRKHNDVHNAVYTKMCYLSQKGLILLTQWFDMSWEQCVWRVVAEMSSAVWYNGIQFFTVTEDIKVVSHLKRSKDFMKRKYKHYHEYSIEETKKNIIKTILRWPLNLSIY